MSLIMSLTLPLLKAWQRQGHKPKATSQRPQAKGQRHLQRSEVFEVWKTEIRPVLTEKDYSAFVEDKWTQVEVCRL